jgi:hypothetical protein
MSGDMMCSLCGAPSQGQPHTWMNEVRVLYAIRRVWSSPILSGVGLHDQETLRVPPGCNQRYDDPDHDPSFDMIVDSWRWHALTLIIPDDMITSWGALFHDSCWNVLVEASRPYDVDVDILHRLFLSFPLYGNRVDWGHNYGWYNREMYCANPFNPPEVSRLLDESIRERADSQRPETSSTNPYIASTTMHNLDGSQFFKLPPEVRESILVLLPSRDVGNLCATIRAFAELELSETFWASRFSASFEYDYIFEALNPIFGQNYLSFRHLYTGLVSLSNSPGLRNRKRVWGILKPFTGLLNIYSKIKCDGKPLATFWEPHLEQRDLEWQCLKPTFPGDPSGLRLSIECRMLFARQVCLDYITGTYVSRIAYLDKHYITGIRFLQRGGGEVRLGYILPSGEEFLDILGGDEVSDGLGGFILAIGLRGINAIALISGAGKVSNWVGSYEGCRRRSLLERNGSTYNLRAQFDVSQR